MCLHITRDGMDPAGCTACVLFEAHHLLRLAAPVQELGGEAAHGGSLRWLLLGHHCKLGLHDGPPLATAGGLEAVRDLVHRDAVLLLELARVLGRDIALVGDDPVHFRTPRQPLGGGLLDEEAAPRRGVPFRLQAAIGHGLCLRTQCGLRLGVAVGLAGALRSSLLASLRSLAALRPLGLDGAGGPPVRREGPHFGATESLLLAVVPRA
mmetsp:Transcript_104983/g.279308  ORF Transcript_104983/g.279308 Transcript_104983/m.279308 type:complete len:209 (-) Transcript_104983:537-1163(-)